MCGGGGDGGEVLGSRVRGDGELFFCRGGGCCVGVEGRAGEGRGLERYVWGAAELGEGVWGCSQE